MEDMQSLGAYYETSYTLAKVSGVAMVITLLLCVLLIVCQVVMFRKAYYGGWEAIVPIYNLICMCRIGGLNPLILLLALVPIANAIVLIIMYIKYYKAFGVGVGMIFMIILFPIIALPIVAFSKKYEYQGC